MISRLRLFAENPYLDVRASHIARGIKVNQKRLKLPALEQPVVYVVS